MKRLGRAVFGAHLVLIAGWASIPCHAADGPILRCRASSAPFSRGYCAVRHSTQPEGWIRASASVNRATGIVRLKFQLETDDALRGPKGGASVTLLGQHKSILARLRMSHDVSRLGKSCGKADKCGITNFTIAGQIPIVVARAVVAMRISIHQTGSAFGIAPRKAAIVAELTRSLSIKIFGMRAGLDQSENPTTVPVTLQYPGKTRRNHPMPALTPRDKIIGGAPVADGEYPFVVALFEPTPGGYVQKCGGSLISRRWVLTAAHCHVTTRWRIVVGRTNLSNAAHGEVLGASAVFTDPSYNRSTKDADAALLKLSKPADYQTLALPKGASPSQTPLITAGWGVTTVGGPPTVRLRRVSVKLLPKAPCNAAYDGRLTPTMLCAGTTSGGNDSCQGDSGGPLFQGRDNDPARFIQIGIVSWGQGCAEATHPGVYTDLVAVEPWIKSVIRDE